MDPSDAARIKPASTLHPRMCIGPPGGSIHETAAGGGQAFPVKSLGRGERMDRPRRRFLGAKSTLGLLTILMAFAAQTRAQQVEWPYYGGDQGGSRYSPLTDINAGNLGRLRVAWQWKHWETRLEDYGTTPGFFENTPLMIDGVLYVTTPYNSAAALDAETGKELWRFDGEAYKLGQILSGSGWKLRGTAVWRDGGKIRIMLNSRYRMFELDATTGKPVPTFGDNG